MGCCAVISLVHRVEADHSSNTRGCACRLLLLRARAAQAAAAQAARCRACVLSACALLLTRRANGSFLISRSVLFWYLRISSSARVPGLYLFFSAQSHAHKQGEYE